MTLLRNPQVDGVISFLSPRLYYARSNLYTVPGYETVEYLSQRPECIELLARRTDGRSRGLYRIRVFRMPVGVSQEERQRALRKAFNTVDAVKRIGDHPNLHRVTVWQNDDGDILELSDWSEAGTLKHFLANHRGRLQTEEVMAICRGIALALAEAHRFGIYHRAVKPEHVLMIDGIPKLMDFDLSYDLERPKGDVTVIPDPSVLKDDGYTAPELLEGKGLTESTDLFGLGVIAYELAVGQKPFASARRLAALGGRLSDEQVRKLRDSKLPGAAVQAITAAVIADANARLSNADEMAQAFQTPAQPEPVPNAPLAPGSRYDVYEIVRLIGQGADGQVYLASAEEQEQVVLKLFDRDVPRERIFRQVRNASSVVSRHVVRHAGRPGHWQTQRFFAVMEYVEGETLRRRIERGDRPDSGSLKQVALGLLDALAAMHGRCDEVGQAIPLIHGDVKPDNVLLTSSGEPKLTDFSIAGLPRTDRFQGTPGYVAPDCILDTEMKFSQDGDLFALGVTLWEYTFGSRPYEHPSVAARPHLPDDARVRFTPALCGWFAKSVATRADDRFSSAAEMLEAFSEAVSPSLTLERPAVVEAIPPESLPAVEAPAADFGKAPPPAPAPAEAPTPLPAAVGVHENAFVAYLNSLANTSPANDGATAEWQQSSPFFARIRVPNPISDSARRWLIEEDRSVILTGNAGDGKTTIAAEIYRRLTDKDLPPDSRVEVSGHNLVIIKDMSELTDDDRARYLEEAFAEGGPRYLIVSNTGTLLKGVSRAHLEGLDPHGTESELLGALEADEARDILDGRFRLLNVGRTDSIETACRVFRRMLEAENWGNCEMCDLVATCPIYENLRLVRENEATLVERVELLYRRLYEYGVRLTMRQMTGHLAYALTAGRDCAQVRGMSATALAERGLGFLFPNRFFGDDGRQPAPESGQMEPVKQVRLADFGVALDPWFERDAWSGNEARVPLSARALDLYRRVRGMGDVPDAASRRQVRRLAYFFGQFDAAGEAAQRRYLSAFLRSPMLLDYLRIARGAGKVPPVWEADWRRRIVQVLQEYFAGVRLPEGLWRDTDPLYVTLNRRSAGAGTQLVLAAFATTDFQLIARKRHVHLDVGGWHLVLVKRGGVVEMPLDLPFLDYVAGRYAGEVAAQLSAFYADRLERFQAQLMAASTDSLTGDGSLRLLRLGPDRKLSPITLRFGDGRLEVL